MKNIIMYLRWALSIIAVDGMLKLTSAIIYPIIIYPLRKPVRWLWGKQGWYKWIAFPFWIFLNDGKSNDVGYDWFWRAKGIFPTSAWNRWKLSYLWTGIRNPAWNVYEFIKPKRGVKNNLTILKGDGIDRILKWKLYDGTPNNNKGDLIDFKKAKFGVSHIQYDIDGTDYFTYSKTWMKYGRFFRNNYLLHHELQIGWNNSRPKIKCKYVFKKITNANINEYMQYYL